MTVNTNAEKLVRQFSLGAVSTLLVPALLAEWLVLPAIQLTLLHRLCDLYGQPFIVNAAKAKIAVTLSWLVTLSAPHAGSIALLPIPLLGTSWHRFRTALVGSAATYAIGKVFILHFETGGTLLSFDPARLRKYYSEQFAQARQQSWQDVFTQRAE